MSSPASSCLAPDPTGEPCSERIRRRRSAPYEAMPRGGRAAFSDSALQPLGFQDLDSLMDRVREFGEEHSNMPPGSRRLEFERRFPGALTPFDAWSEWRRIEFGDDETPERLRLLMRGLSGDGSNSATTSSRSSRYQLFTECAPVKLSRWPVSVHRGCGLLAAALH